LTQRIIFHLVQTFFSTVPSKVEVLRPAIGHLLGLPSRHAWSRPTSSNILGYAVTQLPAVEGIVPAKGAGGTAPGLAQFFAPYAAASKKYQACDARRGSHGIASKLWHAEALGWLRLGQLHALAY
jgi:hypothetical protein